MKKKGDRGARPVDRSTIRHRGRGRSRPRDTARAPSFFSSAGLGAILGALLLAAVPVLVAALPDLPGPLQGPGHPELARRDAKRLGKAVAKLEDGDLAAARKAAAKASPSAARRLLELQLAMAESAEPPVPELEQLCADNPSYAAAWVTLAEAAELGGLGATALEAARRSAELWPQSPWAHRAGELEGRLASDRLALARTQAAEGNAEAALESVESALALAPANRDALLLKSEVLTELGRTEDADTILRGMGDDPEALARRARLAEGRNDLAAAMALWEAVPAGVPGRDEALRRVQLDWRRQNLPGYVQAAIVDDELDRAGLAAVLVGLVPEAHAIGGGQVPLLSDIVGLEAKREILTTVRIGAMQADRLEHRFYPRRKVDPDEARRAIDTLCSLLGRVPPQWCAPEAPEAPGCVDLTSPVSGLAVADVVLRTADGEVP
jgi:tetratricopeptide (TPR) repeat protein